MRVVLDSNVLIAAFTAHGSCAELLEHCVRQHEPVASGDRDLLSLREYEAIRIVSPGGFWHLEGRG